MLGCVLAGCYVRRKRKNRRETQLEEFDWHTGAKLASPQQQQVPKRASKLDFSSNNGMPRETSGPVPVRGPRGGAPSSPPPPQAPPEVEVEMVQQQSGKAEKRRTYSSLHERAAAKQVGESDMYRKPVVTAPPPPPSEKRKSSLLAAAASGIARKLSR